MSDAKLRHAYSQVARRAVPPERFGRLLDAMAELVESDLVEPKDRIAAFKATTQGLKDIVLQSPEYVIEVDQRKRSEVVIDVEALGPQSEAEMVALVEALKLQNGADGEDIVNADIGG